MEINFILGKNGYHMLRGRLIVMVRRAGRLAGKQTKYLQFIIF